jgi:hypothetical protein
MLNNEHVSFVHKQFNLMNEIIKHNKKEWHYSILASD